MSVARMSSTRGRLTVASAVTALVASGVVAGNIAQAGSGPSVLDYAQCQNGAPGSSPVPDCNWINGILNASGSQYREDQVTAQRLTISFPDKGAGDHSHSVTLNYLDRKAGIHAYDSLATADETMADADTDAIRCLGITSICPGVGQAPSTTAIATDSHTIGPVGTGATTAIATHQIAGVLKLWGGTFAAATGQMSDPQHDNASSNSGDDYATTTITFHTSGNGTHVVQLLFGGHLAAGLTAADGGSPRGWGTGLGAADVSGGPYHIKLAAVDLASAGNRDNQIMSNAIIKITPQGSTLETTPSTDDGDAATDDSQIAGSSGLSAVTDHLEMTPASGHAPTGTATFTLYGPLTAPDYNDCTDPATGVDGNVAATPDTGNALTPKSGSSTVWEATSDPVDMTGFAPGVYQWVADYLHGSDQYNTDEDGTCGDSAERVAIIQAPASGASTQTLVDNVTVSSDAGTPSGTVDWYLYKSLTACQTDDAANLEDSDVVGDSGDDANNDLDVNGDASSKEMTPDVPDGGHTYYWKVVYSGDTSTAGGIVEDCEIQAVALQNAPITP